MDKKYISRLPYLTRTLLLVVGAGLAAAMISPLLSPEAGPILLAVFILIVIPIKIFALDVPRIRSIGWSPWLLLLLIVPAVGGIMQILLYVMPPGPHTEENRN